ncbi:S-adenosyl-L-methionine-dependent methyltransferase [Diplogelasinospora grovesii]|uniref:DNA (cytosine-5-)-methyltransferase n=1 Tax=Diplogelasinospora grovesii TaxID=303347 RepID=A0AAN6NA30_9PEZI|nr:S-adenosyl-L-methionine-dependent methyltransferase [Diplogelasinospora grovesii]
MASLPFLNDGQDYIYVEEEEENLMEVDLANLIDLTGDSPYLRRGSLRDRGRGRVQAYQQYTREDGMALKVGMVVELNQPSGDPKIRFLKIRSIIRDDHTHEFMLRGWAYSRGRDLDGIVPLKLNEVYLLVFTDNSDPRPWEEQALVDVHPSKAARQRELRTTNAPFPEWRFRAEEYRKKGREWVTSFGPLVCRYRYFEYYNGPSNRDARKPCEWALSRVTEEDADDRYKTRNDVIVNNWRGGKTRGGSYLPNQGSRIPTVDLEQVPGPSERAAIEPIRLLPGQRYSAGDAFAGAGGVSRGMERAGAHVVFAIDHWSPAVASLRSNFRQSDIYHMDVTDFINNRSINYRVDLLHLSPPCQVWSPAHTRPGRNDEDNTAVLFSCTHLVDKIRPRVFTLEQTFGMLHSRFRLVFNTLIHGFAMHGYSVRWKVVHLASYGLPQPRKRLIIIGAGPGEKLPPFPEPTHSRTGSDGLLPLVTAWQALAPLRRIRAHEHHQPATTRRFGVPKTPWDPNRPLPHTITCGGSDNYHWDGTRDFTPLELATLQGFPRWHNFTGGYIKKQIGNAFPPSIVKVFYEHLISWLDRQDGVDRINQACCPPRFPQRAIVESRELEVTGFGNAVVFEDLTAQAPAARASPNGRVEVDDDVEMLDQSDVEIVDITDSDGDEEVPGDCFSDTETLRGDSEPREAMSGGTSPHPVIILD